MKKILMILLIIFLVVIAAYAVTHLPIRASLNKKFCLWEKQSAIIEPEGLKITLINAIYSPCPKNAMCFWSGIGVDLNISYTGNSTRVLGVGSTGQFGYMITSSDISNLRSCFVVEKR